MAKKNEGVSAPVKDNPKSTTKTAPAADTPSEFKVLQGKYPRSRHGHFVAVAKANGLTLGGALEQAVDEWVAKNKAALIAELSK